MPYWPMLVYFFPLSLGFLEIPVAFCALEKFYRACALMNYFLCLRDGGKYGLTVINDYTVQLPKYES